MKYPVLLSVLLFRLLSQPFALAIDQAASSVRSIYLFKDVMKSNTTLLKTSGFNTVVIFGVGILGNGDIMVIMNNPFKNTTDIVHKRLNVITIIIQFYQVVPILNPCQNQNRHLLLTPFMG